MLIAFLLIGCGASTATPAPAPESAPMSIPILIDDVEVTRWVPGDAILLTSLLPEGAPAYKSWHAVRGHAGERTWVTGRPYATWEGAEVQLYLSDDRPSIGVFRWVDPSLPKMVQAAMRGPASSMTGVESVSIIVHPPPPPEVDGQIDELVGRWRDHGPLLIDEALLQSLPAASAQRLQDTSRTVRAVLDAATASDAWGSVSFKGPETLEIARETADAWTLKRNRKGQWLVRGPDGEELRGVTALTVTGK